MKFLADENIPAALVNDLKRLGYDILRVDEIRKGMDDREVLELSFKEKRILITFDKDFGRLAVREKQNCVGVILLRVTPVSVQYVKNRLLYLFSNFADFEGKLFVIEENVIRERKLY